MILTERGAVPPYRSPRDGTTFQDVPARRLTRGHGMDCGPDWSAALFLGPASVQSSNVSRVPRSLPLGSRTPATPSWTKVQFFALGGE